MGNSNKNIYKSKNSMKQEKLTDWKNEPTFNDLYADKDLAGNVQEKHRERLRRYDEIRDGGKPITKTAPGKSTTRPKLVRKQSEYKYASLEDALLGTEDLFDLEGVGQEDYESARQNQIVLNYQFRNKIRFEKLVEDIVRTDVDEGTVIGKVGWKSEYGKAMVEKEEPVYADAEQSLALMQQAVSDGSMTQEQMMANIELGEPMQIGVKKVMVEEEKLIENHPTVEVRNSANIIIDTTCEGDITKAEFLIEEYPITLAEMKKEEYKKVEVEVDDFDKDGNPIKKKEFEETGKYRNLHLIDEKSEEFNYDEHNGRDAQEGKLSDKARRKLKAFEYWGYWDIHGDGTTVAIVATWVGKVLVRLEENPFPHKKIPYFVIKYMPVKKEVMGEPDAYLLEENQEAVGKTTRAIQDIMANDAVGQEFIDETLFPSPVERENYRQGRTVFFRNGLDPKKAIYKNNVTGVNPIAMQWINHNVDDAEAMSATLLNQNAPSNQSVNSQKRVDSSNSKRESSVLRRITSGLVDAARLIISMNAVYLKPEEVVRTTNKEYVQIKRDDLQGYHDIKINIQTPEMNNAIASDLSMLLQTGQQTMPEEVVMKIWSRILKLKGQYDLSRQVEDYKPQPNPKQEALLDMQIEEQRLKIEKAKKDIEEVDSRIHERVSRVIENEKDVENKQSQNLLRQQQALESDARTRKIEAEIDNIEAEFVDNQSGDKRAREVEDKYIDAEIDMTKEEIMSALRELEQLKSQNKNKKEEE